MIPPAAMPFKTGLVYTYDCGEFEKCMDRALERAQYRGFEERRSEAKKRGKLRGIGVANPIERAAGPPGPETAEIRFDPTGTVTLLVGTTAQGQSHETMYKIILSDKLGLDANDIAFLQGDTSTRSPGAPHLRLARGGDRRGQPRYAPPRRSSPRAARSRRISSRRRKPIIEFASGTFSAAVHPSKAAMPPKEVARAALQPGQASAERHGVRLVRDRRLRSASADLPQ